MLNIDIVVLLKCSPTIKIPTAFSIPTHPINVKKAVLRTPREQLGNDNDRPCKGTQTPTRLDDAFTLSMVSEA